MEVVVAVLRLCPPGNSCLFLPWPCIGPAIDGAFAQPLRSDSEHRRLFARLLKTPGSNFDPRSHIIARRDWH